MRLLTVYVLGDPVLPSLISARLVRLSIEQGNTGDSAYGYVTHAITVGPLRGDYEAAYEWGALALAVNERFSDRTLRAKVLQQFSAHVTLWRRPFETWPVLLEVWGGLALTSLYPGAGEEVCSRWRELEAAHLRTLAENCPENFRCYHLLSHGCEPRHLKPRFWRRPAPSRRMARPTGARASSAPSSASVT